MEFLGRTAILPSEHCEECGKKGARIYIYQEEMRFGTPDAARILCDECYEKITNEEVKDENK